MYAHVHRHRREDATKRQRWLPDTQGGTTMNPFKHVYALPHVPIHGPRSRLNREPHITLHA
jgi:hypothetical protein